MEKIANGNEKCYNGDESDMKGCEIAPIGGLFPKVPEGDCKENTEPQRCNCRESSVVAAAMGEIDQIISELTEYEKEQLLFMILQAGIPMRNCCDSRLPTEAEMEERQKWYEASKEEAANVQQS